MKTEKSEKKVTHNNTVQHQQKQKKAPTTFKNKIIAGTTSQGPNAHCPDFPEDARDSLPRTSQDTFLQPEIANISKLYVLCWLVFLFSSPSNDLFLICLVANYLGHSHMLHTHLEPFATAALHSKGALVRHGLAARGDRNLDIAPRTSLA